MNEEVFSKLEKMSRTCHALAKHNRPFSDFVWQSQLHKAKGLNIGTMYRNDKSGRLFTQAIADTECKFCSILSGATDSSVTENALDGALLLLPR